MKRFFSALLVALLWAGAVSAAVPPIPPTTPLPYLANPAIGLILRNQGWSLISSQPQNMSQAALNTPTSCVSGALNGCTSFIQEVSPVSVSFVRLVYGNWYGNAVPNGELPNTNPIWVHGAVWDIPNTAAYEATFNGQRFVQLPSAHLVVSDPDAFQITANTAYGVGSACMVTSITNTCPTGVTVATNVQPTQPNGYNLEDNASTIYSGISRASSAVVFSHTAILGFTGSTPAKSIASALDSIAAGTGDQGDAMQGEGGWIKRIANQNFSIATVWPISTAAYGFVNIARAGDTLANFLSASQSRNRLALASFATTVIDNGGTNDLCTSCLATMKANKLAVGVKFLSQNQKYIAATLLPRTTSTDGWETVANQTQINSESVRVAFNDWLRDSSASGFVAQEVAACLANATCAAATSNSPRVAFYDAASQVEVNSSNVLTVDGGYWKAGNTCPYTGTVTTQSNTGQFTDSALGGTVNTYRGYTMTFTSGVNANANSTVLAQTAANLIQVGGFSSTPANGDAYKLCTNIVTIDGTHPTTYGHVLIAQGFSTGLIQ